MIYRNPDNTIALVAPTQQAFEDCCCKAKYKLTPCPIVVSGGCPTKMTVIISSLTWCPDCVDNRDWSYKWNPAPPNLNGTYLLSGGPASWSVEFAGSGNLDYYDGHICAGGVVSSTDFNKIIITLTYSGTPKKYQVVVQALKDTTHVWYLFVNVAATAQDCLTTDQTVIDTSDCSYQADWDYTPGHLANASARIISGDAVGNKCIGGLPRYTNSNLATYVGKVITITEIPNVCFTVSDNLDNEIADTVATKAGCWTTCTLCCNEDAQDC